MGLGRSRWCVISLAVVIVVFVLYWLAPHFVLAKQVKQLQTLNGRLHEEIAKLQMSKGGGSTEENSMGEIDLGRRVYGDTDGLLDENSKRGSEKWASTRSSRCDIIHIGFVAAGYNASRQVATVIKTILFYRHNPLHFHFISDLPARHILNMLMQSWQLPAVNFSFYDTELLIGNISWIPTFHYSGVYGLLKLAIPNLLSPTIESIIILDADIMLNADIALLWHFFEVIKKQKKLIGIVENQSNWYLGNLWQHHHPWPALGRGFNTGVVLYNLEVMRQWGWYNVWSAVARKYYSSPTALADQDVINAVIKEYPHVHLILPCAWNVQLSDNSLSEFCYQDAENFHIIHWNSPKKMEVENNNGAYFRTLYEGFLEYNGNLLRHELITCNSAESSKRVYDHDESNDPCFQFRNEAKLKYRTHPFFLGRNLTSGNAASEVTLISQLSMDRLQLLEPLCRHWTGPVSVSVYASDEEAIKLINYFNSYSCLRHRNNIAIHIVYADADSRFYPINYLRNVALDHLVTRYAFLLDIDFLPMFDLHDYLVEAARVLGAEKRALIVPAFETHLYKLDFPPNKTALMKMLEAQVMQPFRNHEWRKGHAPTNYEHWKEASGPYRIQWAPDFEPYVVLSRPFPAYDNRFVGFGWNKVSHIMELHQAGYEFVVLPDGFVIHIPHSPSLDISNFRSSAVYRDCLQVLKKEFQQELYNKYQV